MTLRLSVPDSAALANGTPFLRMLTASAAELGGRLEMDERFGFVGRYTPPGGRARPIFGKSLGLNSDAAAAIAADKDYTARWLAADDLPTPAGRIIFNDAYRARMELRNKRVAASLPGAEAARDFGRHSGFPIIIKPNCGSEGDDVHRADSAEDLDNDLHYLLARHERLRVETFLRGKDYRLLVLDHEVVLAYQRCPFSVLGDGERSVRTLVEVALAKLAQTHRGAKLKLDDARIARNLSACGVTLNTVLPSGERLDLLGNANLSTGGSLIDLSDRVPAMARDIAIKAVAAIGLRVAGVDILAPDLLAAPDGATILEVNSAPGLDHFASESPDHHDRASKIVTAMLSRL